jgi:hypothetical protein
LFHKNIFRARYAYSVDSVRICGMVLVFPSDEEVLDIVSSRTCRKAIFAGKAFLCPWKDGKIPVRLAIFQDSQVLEGEFSLRALADDLTTNSDLDKLGLL